MADARLRTAEAELLGLHRVGDVEGWEIPGRYLEFLRGGAGRAARRRRPPQRPGRPLARLGCCACSRTTTRPRRPGGRRRPGDLAGLARAFARERRLDEALACLDAAIAGPADPPPPTARFEPPRRRPEPSARRSRGGRPACRPTSAAPRPAPIEAGRPIRRRPSPSRGRPSGSPSTAPTCCAGSGAATRRRTPGRALAAGPGRTAIVAAIELAKIREHRLRDRLGALHVAADALDTIERRRRLGRPEPRLEADLLARSRRLRRRLAARDATPARARRRARPAWPARAPLTTLESGPVRCVDRTLQRATFPRPRGNRPHGGPAKGGGTVERRGHRDPDRSTERSRPGDG